MSGQIQLENWMANALFLDTGPKIIPIFRRKRKFSMPLTTNDPLERTPDSPARSYYGQWPRCDDVFSNGDFHGSRRPGFRYYGITA